MMAPEKVIVNNIDKLKMAIDARETTLLCMKCGEWKIHEKIKDLADEPKCGKCGSAAAGAALSFPRRNTSLRGSNVEGAKAKN